MSGPPIQSLPPVHSVSASQHGRALGALIRKATNEMTDESSSVVPARPAAYAGGQSRHNRVANNVLPVDEDRLEHHVAPSHTPAPAVTTVSKRMSLGELGNVLNALTESDDDEGGDRVVSADWNPKDHARQRHTGPPMSGASMAARMVAGMRPKAAE